MEKLHHLEERGTKSACAFGASVAKEKQKRGAEKQPRLTFHVGKLKLLLQFNFVFIKIFLLKASMTEGEMVLFPEPVCFIYWQPIYKTF